MNNPGDRPGPLMLDLEGTRLSAEEEALIADSTVGGVILFARNYRSPAQLRELVASMRRHRPRLLVAVDQEGGRVQRFREGFTRIPPMARFLADYRRAPEEAALLVRDTGWLMAAELREMDLDFSFAPVLDVDADYSQVIGDRAFSPRPEEVVALAGAFIQGMNEAGMAATGKHFPGHGGVRGDSHLELPEDVRDWPAIRERDWLPFVRLAARLGGIMPAHIVFSRLDEHPVGFSRFWLQDKLRDELQFDGMIFSDDLSMAGAAAAGGYGDRARAARAAGCDMVLVCNHRAGALEALEALRGEHLCERRAGAMRGRPGEVVSSKRCSRIRARLASLC